MTSRTISAYGTGARPVPRYIALACKGWYLLHLWRTSQGDEYVVGSYGIWSGNSNNAIKGSSQKTYMNTPCLPSPQFMTV